MGWVGRLCDGSGSGGGGGGGICTHASACTDGSELVLEFFDTVLKTLSVGKCGVPGGVSISMLT